MSNMVQNGKGSRARNVGPKFKENYDAIFRKEFRLVQDNENHWYVIPADELQVFCHWVAAMEGQRRMPGNFNPVQIDGPHKLVFKEWREEE